MSDDVEEGPALPGPSAAHKRTIIRGATGLDIRIYQLVRDADDAGLTADEIHDRVKDVSGFDTDTKAWWEGLSGKRPFVIASAGLARVRVRIMRMVNKGVLVSDYDPKRVPKIEARYTAGEVPKGYRRKNVQRNPAGWFDIDVDAEEKARRRHIAHVTWENDVEAELAKAKAKHRTDRLIELLLTARDLLA